MVAHVRTTVISIDRFGKHSLFVTKTRTRTLTLTFNTLQYIFEANKKESGDKNRIIYFLSSEFMTLSPIKNIRRLNFMMLTYRLNETECQYVSTTCIFVRRFC